MASNHHALYIRALEYGVGEVSEEASTRVPTAIAIANTINKVAVNRVENRIEANFFCIDYYFVQKYYKNDFLYSLSILNVIALTLLGIDSIKPILLA